ncbi:MAG: CYTH domain-containing protein [Nanoarchaeota archaeon]|nr:CYTH domain-containing protein [Nanoarchaeota archaeon]
MNIEVEARSFVSKEKFEQLLDFFTKHAQSVGVDDQESWYFDGFQDLRIQRNGQYAKVWLKKGKMHDAHREEVEIRSAPESFDQLAQLFAALGYTVAIKWFRKRQEFLWDGIKVCLDDTKGYGYIIELECMANDSDKNAVYHVLMQKLMNLDVSITSREEFEQRFEEYKLNWRSLVE